MKYLKLFESINIEDIKDIKITLDDLLNEITDDNSNYEVKIKHVKRNDKYHILIYLSDKTGYSIDLYEYLDSLIQIENYMNLSGFYFSNIHADGRSIKTRKLGKENNHILYMKDLTWNDLNNYEIMLSFTEIANFDDDLDNDKLEISRETWLGARGLNISGWEEWVSTNKNLFR